MSTAKQIKSTGCCELIDPTLWDDKIITWVDKLFITDHVVSFFHIPLNFGSKMTKNMKLVTDAGAESSDQIVLCDEGSFWGMEMYIGVNKDIAGVNMTKISGTFLTKVFEGSYSKMGSWITEMNEFVKGKEKEVKKLYFFYTACPKCAKTYGKNYVVIFAKVE